MKVKCINDYGSNVLEKGKIYKVLKEVSVMGRGAYYLYGINNMNFNSDKFEVVKNIEKTFKEVIADIKEGEVWENISKTISLYPNGTIEIESNDRHPTINMVFNDEFKYKLQRKKVSFEEAFKSYEEDERVIIESCESGKKYNQWYEEDTHNISIKEIRGLWIVRISKQH